VVERNPLRIVTAEDEANIFESAFKIIDTRFVLHPQTPFCAFPLQVVMQFTTFPTWSVCIAHHLLERGLHQTADIHSLYALLGHISSPELLQRVVTQTAG